MNGPLPDWLREDEDFDEAESPAVRRQQLISQVRLELLNALEKRAYALRELDVGQGSLPKTLRDTDHFSLIVTEVRRELAAAVTTGDLALILWWTGRLEELDLAYNDDNLR